MLFYYLAGGIGGGLALVACICLIVGICDCCCGLGKMVAEGADNNRDGNVVVDVEIGGAGNDGTDVELVAGVDVEINEPETEVEVVAPIGIDIGADVEIDVEVEAPEVEVEVEVEAPEVEVEVEVEVEAPEVEVEV